MTVELGVTESSVGTVATKEYTDEEIATEAVMFSMDITGMGTGTALQNAMASYLNDMYPAATLNTNKVGVWSGGLYWNEKNKINDCNGL